MFLGTYTVRDCKLRLTKLKNQIKIKEGQDDKKCLEEISSKFYSIVYDLSLGLYELYTISDDDTYYYKYNDLLMRITEISKTTTVNDFINVLDSILDVEYIEQEVTSIYGLKDRAYDYNEIFNMKRRYNINSSNFFKTFIKDYTNFNSDNMTNIFIPDCYNGVESENLLNAFDNHDNVFCYGNESSKNYNGLVLAKERMHRVVKGPLKGSRIQNNAFDIVYIQPIINYSYDEVITFNNRNEREYINDLFKYGKPNSLFIIEIPIFRMYKNICTMLAKNLKNITIVKTDKLAFNDLGIITIIGQRDETKELKKNEYNKLRQCFNIEKVNDIFHTDMFKYNLTFSKIPIELFKGSVLDIEEIDKIFTKSHLIENSFESQKVDKIEDNIKNPLLPFNIGQLGLVLTSGCLDGIVQEKDGNCHLIKGRVSKQTVSTESAVGFNNVEIVDTTVNKVEINVLMPNGEFKVLA